MTFRNQAVSATHVLRRMKSSRSLLILWRTHVFLCSIFHPHPFEILTTGVKMRILSFSMCLFLLLISSSLAFYFYLVVMQYVHSKAYEYHKSAVHKIVSRAKTYVMFESLQSSDKRRSNPSSFKHRLDNQESVPRDTVETFMKQLYVKLRKAELKSGNVLIHRELKNKYNVTFQRRRGLRGPDKLTLCLTTVDLLTKTKQYSDFLYHRYYPDKSIEKALEERNVSSGSCALITNAGSLKSSNKGKEIDSHDIVLRFNDAPTEGYEVDVGSKTTIRIFNSKVVARSNFDLMYREKFLESINLVWDPANFKFNAERWFQSPEHNFFDNYKKARLVFPEVPFYIIHPSVLWNAWCILQGSTYSSIPKNPPTSGFIGILLLVKFCTKVVLYEYVPSVRISERCHYYDNITDLGCTLGEWHPLATEKLYALKLNVGSDYDLYLHGKTELEGCKRK